MDVKEKRYTAEEFWEYAQLPENQHRKLELVNGEIVEDDMASVKSINTIVAGRIITSLNNYVIPRNLGNVSVPDGGFRLNDYMVRQPDIGFISWQRYPEIIDGIMPAPELAVEVVSQREDIFQKTRDYLYNGVLEVWAIYPKSQELIIFWLDDDSQVATKRYGINDVLRNRAVLPDFEMPIKDIFPSGYSPK
ncbi:MAG: Uma2 family endonuclease [Anaerolineae bacterium]|jgi:Uma2 family endonuclease|nr:Uma2 family endonuclease [Anaerolineae bacterium]